MDNIKQTLSKYKISFVESVNGLKNHWYLIFVTYIFLLASVIFNMITIKLLLGPLSILYGLMNILFKSGLISTYMYIVNLAIFNKKLDKQALTESFTYYISKIYGVFFIIWLGMYIINSLIGLLGANWRIGNIVILVSGVVLLNPLPEILYQKNYVAIDSIKYSFNFMKEYWIEWMIPNFIVGFLYYKLFKNTSNVVDSFKVVDLVKILKFIIVNLVFPLIILFRGNLFKNLDKSNLKFY